MKPEDGNVTPLKPQTNVRLSDEGRALLDALAARYGYTNGAMVEMLVREKAKAEGIELPVAKGRKRK